MVLIYSGDGSARQVAKTQPMKLAAMEGLTDGKEGAGLILFGIVTPTKNSDDSERMKEISMKIEVPKLLSFMSFSDPNAFVPGINDLLNGNEKHGVMSVAEKKERGNVAVRYLTDYKEAKKSGNKVLADQLKAQIMSNDFQNNYFKYLGYGYINNTDFLIPNIPVTFYSFHIMVMLGMWFVLIFALSIWWVIKGTIEHRRWFLWLALLSIPLAYLASELGWLVAEFGRQPWVIQDLMPTTTAVSKISTESVMVTFILFAIIFTTLLVAEVSIMIKQIKIGPKEEGGHEL